jgi:hypothetical protein
MKSEGPADFQDATHGKAWRQHRSKGNKLSWTHDI